MSIMPQVYGLFFNLDCVCGVGLTGLSLLRRVRGVVLRFSRGFF